MSDLSAAAAAMGVPEAITERSARARAESTGQTYEEVLAAWAGGEAVASAPAAPAEAPATEPAATPSAGPAEGPSEGPAPAAETPEPSAPAAPAGAPAPAPVPAEPQPVAVGAPPILDSPPDRPLLTVLGGVGVLIMAVLLGFILPALPAASNEVRTSNFALTETGETGRDVYQRAGCASCHTQMIRTVVADFGLGPVTLADTNQVVGYRRIGPDLANAGGRLNADQLAAAITGGNHPPISLSQDALGAVVTYLTETGTAASGGGS